MANSDERFSSDEFDPWAETYDRDVTAQSQFPFAGYHRALDMVLELAAPGAGMSILDIGTGTGNLALRFAARGCELWCTDFSEAMLAKAHTKLPAAHLVHHDLRASWPRELERRFDRIVSAYVFHHFDLEKKVQLCQELCAERLNADGHLIIADLSFPNEKAMRDFARSVGELWEQEPYWLADESVPALAQAGVPAVYIQVSPCAGIYAIRR